MKTPTAILCDQFNSLHLKAVETALIDTIVICASEYATRSPQRNPENPFIVSPKLIKSMLDANSNLFEQLYYILGNKESLSSIFEKSEHRYYSPHVLPDLSQYFPYSSSYNSDVKIVKHKLTLSNQLFSEYEKSLAENDSYCEKNPSASYSTDKEHGRIWVKPFENEGRRRAYWLNTNKAPKIFYDLMVSVTRTPHSSFS